MKYSVGNRVRIVRDPENGDETVGKLGNVESIDHDMIYVRGEGIPTEYSDGSNVFYWEHELELALYEPKDFEDVITRQLRQVAEGIKIPQRFITGSGYASYKPTFDAPALQVPRQADKVRLYISAPISGQPEHNFPALNAAAAKYEAMGYEVFNPATTGVIDGWSWSDYLRYDCAQLVRCHGIVMLSGWRQSRGCQTEHELAQNLGLFVLIDSEVGK